LHCLLAPTRLDWGEEVSSLWPTSKRGGSDTDSSLSHARRAPARLEEDAVSIYSDIGRGRRGKGDTLHVRGEARKSPSITNEMCWCAAARAGGDYAREYTSNVLAEALSRLRKRHLGAHASRQ
jgi:hypothetical protein